jgi:hypothetical protein
MIVDRYIDKQSYIEKKIERKKKEKREPETDRRERRETCKWPEGRPTY